LVNYKPTTATVAIDVSTAILTVTADARGKTYNGSAFSNFTSTITGYVNGDNGSSVFGSITYTDDGRRCVRVRALPDDLWIDAARQPI
jgi:hypothetical protein